MSVEVDIAPEAYRYCPKCLAVFRTSFTGCPQDGAQLAALVHDPLVGQTVAQRYVIDAYVGEGGMGRVYRARHARTGRKFALKVLFGELAADPRMRARFAREARTASALDHPNVVPVLDFGDSETGLSYIAMDFVEGVTLATVIQYEAPMPVERVLRLAYDVCQGLAHAHERGLVHRDLKPDNIMIVRQGAREVPRLVDFGLAIMAEDAGSRVTTGKLFFGTPAYVSPEQTRVSEQIDGRADLFSLGATIYEMVTGKNVFEGATMDVLTAMMAAPRPPMTGRVPGVTAPPALEALVARLLEIDRAKRPGSAAEVAAELERIAGELGARVARTPAAPRALGPDLVAPPFNAQATEIMAPPARRTWWLVGAVVLLGALAAGGVALLGGRESGEIASAATATPDAAPVPGPAPVPVPPPAPAPAPDAGIEAPVAPVLDGPPDAGAPGPRRKPPRPSAPDAGAAVTPRPPPPDPDPPLPSGEVAVGAFSQRYQSVGKKLEDLAAKKGKEAAEPLRKRYFAIPFSDAMRDGALRTDAMRKLIVLEREIDKALR